MPKLKIEAESVGLKDLIDDLEKLIGKYPTIVKESFEAQQLVIEDAVRKQWVSAGGSYGGRIWSSVGHSTKSSEETGGAFGTVGVYKIDSVESKFGMTSKDLSAAQIAYWVENGTSRLRFGGRKDKKTEYDEEYLVRTAANPFISRAYFSTIEQQESAFAEKWNQLIDGVM